MNVKLREFDIGKEQMRHLTVLTQLLKLLKVQHAEEMADLRLAHAIQIKDLRKEENSSVDRFPPQDVQGSPKHEYNSVY